MLINFNSLDIFIIISSSIFFFCLFQGYFSIKNIKNFLGTHPKIATGLILLGFILFICFFLYLSMDVVYAMGPEGSYLPKPEVKISDNNNTLSINNSNINIPDSVARGLTNVGTGAAVAAGVKAGASIAKTSGLTPTAKFGLLAGGGLFGGAAVVFTNTANSYFQRKTDSHVANSTQSNTTTPTTSSNSGSGNGPKAFSVEESTDIDNIMTFLYVNYICHLYLLYIFIAIIILYTSTKVLEKKLNLIFIKNIFGEKFYNLFIKSLTYSSKHNRI